MLCGQQRKQISGFLTLKHRRYRGAMTELCKIIINKSIYNPACIPYFDCVKLSEDLIRTGGNKYQLVQQHCHYDLRKFNFADNKQRNIHME